MKRFGALLLLLVFTASPLLAQKVRVGSGKGRNKLVITTTSLPNGQTTVAYSATVFAKGGTQPYTFTQPSGTLPTGLALAANGVISGTPTVVGTFSFIIRVTDSAGSPATYNQSLAIIVAAGVVIQPLTLSPSALPNGQVAVAYSTSVSASGGTAPYTYSNPGCVDAASCIPTGITLNSSTGALTGTPTNAATYSFKIRATDAASLTSDNAYAITVAAAASPTYLFSDGFESGDFSAWDYVYPQSARFTSVVQSTTKHSGTYAAQFHYSDCGDSTDPTCGGATVSVEGYIIKTFTSTNGYPNGLDHSFTRSYFMEHVNAGGTAGLRKKLYYFNVPATCGGTAMCWNTLVSTTVQNLTTPTTGYFTLGQDRVEGFTTQAWAISTNQTASGACTASPFFQGAGEILTATCSTVRYDWAPDAWYCLELELQANTPGLSDGNARVWVQKIGVDPLPTKILEVTNYSPRGSKTPGISHFRIGDQVSRDNYAVIDEYRYWDDVVINSSYIGP